MLKEVEYIKNMVQNGMYDISKHASDRMNTRKMNSVEIEHIILNNNGTLAKNEGINPRYEFCTNTNDKIIVALGTQMIIPVVVTVIRGGV